jgi:hypothetical protein
VDLNDTPEQARYRAKVRAWLTEHSPAGRPVGVRGRYSPPAPLHASRPPRGLTCD